MQETKVILISGKSGSGKDTLAKMIRDNSKNGAVIIHFADVLKMICSQVYGWNGVKDEFGRTLLQLTGDNIRSVELNYFVDFIVKLFHPDYGVLKGSGFEYVIVPDLRFPNELLITKCEFGDNCWHVNVRRNDCQSTMTEAQKKHASEDIDGLTSKYGADIYVVNDGSKEDLNKISKNILKTIESCKHDNLKFYFQ